MQVNIQEHSATCLGDTALLCSDSHFHLTVQVNKILGIALKTIFRCIPREIMWCAFAKVRILGPYFFEESGVNVFIICDHYIHLLTF